MTREEFLAALAAELQNITTEERDEALKFYNEYLDEAGPENEAGVLEELGSPRRVANIIRANLGAGVPAARGAPEARGQAPAGGSAKPGPELTLDGPDWASHEKAARQAQPDPAPAPPPEGTQGQPGPIWPPRADNRLLWILLLVVTSPIWLGIVGGLFGAVAGLVGGVVGFAAGGLGMLIGGIVACVRAAFLLTSAPGDALVSMACALGMAAVGALMSALGVWIAAAAVPFVFKCIGRLVRAVFGKGGRQG